IENAATVPEQRKYYNASLISYNNTNDKNATYRIFNFQNYMKAAGEKDQTILGVYGWATVYSDEKRINRIKE
ncbi:MAG: hypothetical protein K6G63_04020, partial [Eubacterium sp.]|nr:hypothetical protein [Eubacterium sp.]